VKQTTVPFCSDVWHAPEHADAVDGGAELFTADCSAETQLHAAEYSRRHATGVVARDRRRQRTRRAEHNDDDDDEKRQLLNAQRAGAVPCGRLIARAPGSATTGDVQNRCGSGGGGGCGATHGA